jgi:hypothetical protein
MDALTMQRLRAPFPPERVSWRVGSTTQDKSKGMALAYIDARDVMDRLDDVVGPQNWQCTYPHANGKTVCSIGIRVGEEWVWKSDGAGDTDYEAEKGALSDAFKRAAVRWGIGRYLYDLESPWVQVEARGKTFVIKDSEKARLARMLGGQASAATVEIIVRTMLMSQTVDELQAWASDETNKAAIADLNQADQTKCRKAYADHRTKLAEAEYQAAE